MTYENGCQLTDQLDEYRTRTETCLVSTVVPRNLFADDEDTLVTDHLLLHGLVERVSDSLPKKKGVISIATLLSKSCQNCAARAFSDFCTHCTRQRRPTEADSTHHHSDAFVGAGSPLLAVADQEPGCAPGDFGCGGGEEGIPGDELCAGAGGGGGGGGEGRGVGPEGAGDAACDPGSHGRFARGIGGGGREICGFIVASGGPQQRCSGHKHSPTREPRSVTLPFVFRICFILSRLHLAHSPTHY